MAQVTMLVAAKTAATSTDLVVASGATATIGIFTDTADGIPQTDYVRVYLDTPSADLFMFTLTANTPSRPLPGPGTYRAIRPVTVANIGVFSEGA
ncbi:hypothetical protein [Pseudoxanthomonas sp. CF125]|uniref:hypothetical protein n=1 Tax=Pseudoxanthomonas sp. CF125 TaxID=1855303 RepID=UPI000890C2FC|nr:hypothetical protein [Pseudoxanthomonas sp. CF125]SDQ42280.1 hypothetical protein SAMN05216569_1067 [Pseudoxanthomonas sp. CF125]